LALRTKYADKTKKRPAHTTKLVDDRHPKGLTPTYTYFFTERMASGDFKGIKLQDYSKLIGEEWKALSAGEKKVCVDHFSSTALTDTKAEISGYGRRRQGKVHA
jgi:hypothetical protein